MTVVSSTSSPFGQNEWLVEEMYRKFRQDPSSVDPSWHEFLVDYRPEPATPAAPGNGQAAAPAPAPAPAPSPAPGVATLTLSGPRNAVVYSFTPNESATFVFTQISVDGITWSNADAPFDVTAGTPVSITRNLAWNTTAVYTRVAGASAITTTESLPSA